MCTLHWLSVFHNKLICSHLIIMYSHNPCQFMLPRWPQTFIQRWWDEFSYFAPKPLVAPPIGAMVVVSRYSQLFWCWYDQSSQTTRSGITSHHFRIWSGQAKGSDFARETYFGEFKILSIDDEFLLSLL